MKQTHIPTSPPQKQTVSAENVAATPQKAKNILAPCFWRARFLLRDFGRQAAKPETAATARDFFLLRLISKKQLLVHSVLMSAIMKDTHL